MIKTKDGYAKLIGTTYSGSVSRVLLSNGGDHILGNSGGNIPLNNGTVNTNLNADKVDGYHASNLWRSDGATWNPGANVSLNASANGQEWSFDIRRNNYTSCYWQVWDSSLNTMLKVNADNGKVYAPYNFVGNLEGNATTSTKLLTARTIWGQSFNGTTNIDNTLRIRLTTGNYCEGIRIQTGDGAWSTIILGATADSGTNTNAWSIHRKADNNFAISRNSSDGINGLVMTSTGMGLGTTAPTHRLDVRGDTKITGSIRDLAIGGGIYWNPYVESTTDSSDAASITVVKSGVAGGTTLVLSLMNDANDTILFKTNSTARLYHNSYPILTTLNTYVSNNKGYINGVEITLVNNSDKVDEYHANTIYNAPSFTVNNGNTSNTYILLATITIGGTSLSCAEFTTLFQNRECLDSSSFILSGAIRRNSTTSVTATLSYITLHTKTPRNIYLRSDDGVTFRVYIQSAASTYTTYYRAIPIVDSRNITYSNTGTTSPISGSVLNITATKGGNVNYANSTGNADTLDNYHASGLLTDLSNSNNGVSITVGGTTKSISNISVSYAKYLNSVNRMDYGWNGINYFNASLTAGCAAKVNDSPTSNWWHILRFNHNNSGGYYTDLAVPFNSNSLYWKTVRNGTVAYDHWIKVLDSLNYNEYAPTKTGGGASGTWKISITGNAATASKLGTSTVGATNIPIYLNSGTPTAVNLNSTANNLINNLTTGTSTPTDADYYVSQYVGGGTTTITYHRRPHSSLYAYIKGKAEGTWNISITGNADTVDGYHASKFPYINDNGVWKVYGNSAAAALADNTAGLSAWAFGETRNLGRTYLGILKPSAPTCGIIAHGTIVVFGQGDTHLGIASDYGSANLQVFGGNADKIVWRKKVAFTSDIPTVTNYWWANIKISNASNTDTLPTFGSATIKTRLSIASSTITKTAPTHLQLVINGPNLDSSVTLGLTDWPGIGFHMPNRGWASLIYNGNITAINSNYDGYINYFGAGFIKNGSNDTYVLLGGGGHKLISDFAASGHVHNYLALSGGTMTGVIKSTFASGTWINGVTNAIIKGEYTTYGAILSMPVKNGRVSLSSYPKNDNYIYFGYATSEQISAGTNDFNKKMYWDAANNKLVADIFLGALLGNATTATTATKLSTSSAGNASLPVYFSNGIPVACTKSSIFSNLSNNGDQLSVTVAGYNRLLTVAFASRADSAVDADYAASSDWAEDALHASSADSATNADYATNADTLDGHHSYEFASSGHTHTLRLESTTGTNSITLAHGGKYKLTAGGNSIIFTLPTNTASIAFSGGLISSSNNTLTQASHSITIGGQTETAGYSTCNIINNLSINSLSSSSTTNLTAQITVNGVTSALKTITQLHSRFWDVTRNSATSNISPGNYSATITEVQGNASGITGNLPTTSWYHVYTAAGSDTKYATLLALGMTTDGIWYRKYSNSSWGSWLTVLHSGNIGNYYWANISISSSRNTNTTPRFGQVKINTDSSSYQLNVEGDSYTTGWSRAKNGFYCEGNGVYFTHNGTKGEISVKNNNEFCWGSNSDTLYFNYAAPLNGTPVKNYIWNAGSSNTYASHTTGDITLGSNSNSNYQLKRAGYSSSWYNGRDRAIVRQTSASGYSAIISSKTTNGSWEIGNYTSNGDSLYFTYVTDSNYNSATNNFSAQVYFSSSGSMYATHFYENSDIRYKKILKNLSINSNTIANLPLFDFEWIENNAIGTGTSALAVLLILPNLVSGTDRLTLDYGVLGTIAGITACKELVTLKSELLQLKEKVKLLEDKLRKYENI